MKIKDILVEDYRNEFGPPDVDDRPSDEEFNNLDELVSELGIEPEIWDMMVKRVWRDNNRDGASFKHNIITLAEILEDGVYHEDNYERVYKTLGEYDYDLHDNLNYREHYVNRIEAGIKRLHDEGIVGDSPDALRRYW